MKPTALPSNDHAPQGPPEWWRRAHTFLLANRRIPKSLDEASLAMIGSAGSGKTTLLIPYMESVLGDIPDEFTTVNALVGDPKNDLLPLLRGMGLPLKVISAHVLDPSGWAWRMCEDVTDPVAAEQAAYDMLPDERNGSENRFYSDAPRHILAGVLRELVRSGRPWTLRHGYLFAMSEFYARQILERSADPKTRATLTLFEDGLGTTKANVQASLLTKLGNLATYAAMMENCKDSYSIKQMVRGEQVLVLGGDFRYSHILGPMNALALNCYKRELLSQPDSRTRRHYVIIDEFPKLNYHQPAEEFADFVELGRSRGVRTVIVMQTPRQLVELYGEEGASIILGQCQNKIILRVADHAGATDCSNMLGRVHGYEWTRNVSEGESVSSSPGGHSRSTSYNRSAAETYADRPLVRPEEIMDLPLASRSRGFSGYAISPALARTKRWKFRITPEWIREHVSDRELAFAIDEGEGTQPLPGPLPRDLSLRPLAPHEARLFGLNFDPNGYVP